MGAAALRGWVKTADRLPTEADSSDYSKVLVTNDVEVQIIPWFRVKSREWKYWHPIAELPEVEP
jgi:hypothetical protein